MTPDPIIRWLLLGCLSTAGSLACQTLKPVKNGIDVLQAAEFSALTGRKVGLISNHTGKNLQGISTAILLHRAPQVELKILFSPEHGFQGKLDQNNIAHATHDPTGLPIHSLYTKDRKPNAASLRGLDTLVFDIQDIGCRFYTYISTMGKAMSAAADHKLRFVVLDRPNPINGLEFAGAMRDSGSQHESFVAWHRLPVRHGMTVGELAGMFKAERKIPCELQVIPMQGWQRKMYFDGTGQTWVNPSPNMRSPTQALLYPGVGLLETTNLSVGRGTDTPFEIVGAPWIDGVGLAAAMNQAPLKGLRCVPIQFTPRSSKHQGQLCKGIRFCITTRAAFDPIRLGTRLAYELQRLHPKGWDTQSYNRLLVNKQIFELVKNSSKPNIIHRVIRRQLLGFQQRRAPFLLYE